MKIGITGASGLIGTALTRRLRRDGSEVVRFVRRSPQAPEERGWTGRELDPSSVADLDAVVHLAGAGVGDKRWTAERKQVVLASRVDGTTAVARALAQAQGPRVLLSASAVGYYGDTGDQVVDESAPSGRGFLAEVCRQWEAATAPAEQAGVRVVHLRTGIVLSSAGGALALQLPLFRLGLGAPLGSGRQFVPWITLDDEVRAITHLLTADVHGAANLVAPHPVTNREFTRALGRALHRPTLPVPVPGVALRLALGEFATEGVLIGQRPAPAALTRSGFAFDHPQLEEGLRAVL